MKKTTSDGPSVPVAADAGVAARAKAPAENGPVQNRRLDRVRREVNVGRLASDGGDGEMGTLLLSRLNGPVRGGVPGHDQEPARRHLAFLTWRGLTSTIRQISGAEVTS